MEEPKRVATLSGEVVEQIRRSLLDGLFVSGTRINEVVLSRELAVSRTPIRAALQTLAGEGLLHYTPNRGFTVRAFPLSDIVDAYEMRALAEGLAARLAAERGLSDQARATIEEALAEGDRVLGEGGDNKVQRTVYADINEIFHNAVREAAGSRLVIDVLRLCHQVPQASVHNIMAFQIDDVRERHRWHHKIYDAIISREPREAENLMRQHVASVKTSMVRAASRQLTSRAADAATKPADGKRRRQPAVEK